MKKQYETPVMAMSLFESENVVTTSGNVYKMKNKMVEEGYNVSAFSLKGVF